jgi:hypothetical protein
MTNLDTEEREEREEFHSYIKYYRGSAVAFSITIIALSGGFIYWLTNVLINDKNNPVLQNKYLLIFSLIYFGLAFLSAVSIQFLHSVGSRLLVKCMFYLFVSKQEEAYEKFRRSNDNFTRSDTAVKLAVCHRHDLCGFAVLPAFPFVNQGIGSIHYTFIMLPII